MVPANLQIKFQLMQDYLVNLISTNAGLPSKFSFEQLVSGQLTIQKQLRSFKLPFCCINHLVGFTFAVIHGLKLSLRKVLEACEFALLQ